MFMKKKVEAVGEYIARGGSIKKIPSGETARQPDVTRKNVAGGPVTIITLEEADLFYGEARKGTKPKKAKPSLKIDLSALPEALRAKFINKLKEEADGETCEVEEDSENSEEE